MELIRGLHNLNASHHGCVLTIGKFDGVHKGHQAVLANVISQAKAMGLPATVMVFEPQPEEVFTPELAPPRISLLADKFRLLKSEGLDRLLCVRFNQAFASQSADTFIEELLVERLGVKFLVVGDDFRFGQGRKGDFALLQQAGKRFGFAVVSTASFRMADCRISSTAVREALKISDFVTAESMLGRPYGIIGKVIHGAKKGRTIGYPTANVRLRQHKMPINGVFAVQVEVNGEYYDGVANIGKRPTVDGTKLQLEVHLFNFSGDLYRQRINVMPVDKIRDEIKFESFDELQRQIHLDAQQAQHILATRQNQVSI